MSPVRDSLLAATRALERISDTPRLDAELLLAEACGISRDRLLLNEPRAVPPSFAAMIERRRAGEPIAYILGRRGFWDLELEVGPGVLIPRPDSETLIEAAVAHFKDRDPPTRVLDMGTGPGTLLLAALSAFPEATGVGIDSSQTALDYARRNAQRLKMSSRSTFKHGDWAKGVQDQFDLVLANPPYLKSSETLEVGVREFEPHNALFAGEDGLDDYRRIVPELPRLLSARGLAAVEIGHDQADKVALLMRDAGLDPTLCRDLAGRPRALLVQGA